MKKQTPWAKVGATRAQYKRGVEETIRYHVCDDTRILREIFARKPVRPSRKESEECTSKAWTPKNWRVDWPNGLA